MCFPPDPMLTDLIDGNIKAVDQKDWPKMKEIIQKMQAKFSKDLKKCFHDKDVMAAMQELNEVTEKFYKLPTWE